MRTKSTVPTRFAVCLLAAFNIPFSTFAQGSLTPPGAPAPVMKSLDQVEPRIPISVSTTPGDSNDSFIITNSGSYYLTTNLVATSAKNGIRIAADSVTIDLNGFDFNGAGLGGLGIRIITSIHRQNIVICNGTVRNWTSSGMVLSFGRNIRVEKVAVMGNGGNGMVIGENGIVHDCVAYTNANAGPFLAGITVSQGSVVENCATALNGVNNANCVGISAGAGCTVLHCSASQSNGPNGVGISAGPYAAVTDCAVALAGGTNGAGISAGPGCSVVHCTVSGNTGSGTVGILATERALIESCVVANNGGDGIQASNNCSLVSNTCGNNGGAGIHITGQHNRIDNNNVTFNPGGGIKVDATFNLVVRNCVSGNSVNNYIIVAGNNDAERIGGGSGFVGTDPWANFSF
jgi:hypothetical protein